MLFTLCASFVFHFYFLLLGTPFVKIFHPKISFFGQALGVGFFVHIASFFTLSSLGVRPKDCFFLFVSLYTLLIIFVLILNKKNMILFFELFHDIKKWSFRLFVLTVSFLFFAYGMGYSAPFMFFNKPDSLYYISLADFFWDNSIYDLLNNYNTLTSGVKHLARIHFEARPGLWQSFVPAYSLFGPHSYYYFCPLILVFWNLASAASYSLMNIFFEKLAKSLKFFDYSVFYLVPFFVFVGFENYLSHFIFIPYFVLILALCECLRLELVEYSHKKIVSISLLMAIFTSVMVTVFPEFILAPALCVLTFFFCSLALQIKNRDWKSLRAYLSGSIWVCFFVLVFLLIFGKGGVFHGFSWLLQKAGGGSTRYEALRLAFPNDQASYLLNIFGFPYYSTVMGEKFSNFWGVLLFSVLIWGRVNISRFFASTLGISFFVTFAVFTCLQAYGSIKLLATWSLIVTPLVALSLKGVPRFLFVFLCFSQICIFIFGFSSYVGKNYIHRDFKDMEAVSTYLTQEHSGKDILMFVANHLQSASFTILLSRSEGKVLSALPTKWNQMKFQEKLENKNYFSKTREACNFIEEPLILIKNKALKSKHLRRVKSCLERMKKKSFGGFSLLYNNRLS